MSTINTHVRCVLFISGLICYFCVNCEIINRNCSSYGEVLKQDSKNCVDYTDEDFTEGFEENETESSNQQNETQKWMLQLTQNTGLSIRKNNDDITFQIAKLSSSIEARKKRMKVMDIIPFLIIPGFISAGILPWLIPGMKMAVMGVAMINQMAFTSSLFSLIRGYIFDTSQEEHIVYVNHGYQKYKHKKLVHKHR